MVADGDGRVHGGVVRDVASGEVGVLVVAILTERSELAAATAGNDPAADSEIVSDPETRRIPESNVAMNAFPPLPAPLLLVLLLLLSGGVAIPQGSESDSSSPVPNL